MTQTVLFGEGQGRVADVELKQALEEPGVVLEDVECPVSEAGRAIHQEQALRHESGETLDTAVGLLIGGEGVGFKGGSQSHGLAEGKGETFAGDGVDGAGGVADESDIASGDARESAVQRDGTAWAAAWSCAFETGS